VNGTATTQAGAGADQGAGTREKLLLALVMSGVLYPRVKAGPGVTAGGQAGEMKPHLRLLVVFALVVAGSMTCAAQTSEKPEVRAEAVEMIEHANALSMSPHLPNLERTDTFRVFGTNAGTKEGIFTRVVVQGTGRRDEVTFGDYHNLEVWHQRNVAMVRTDPLAPPEVVDLWTLTPIQLLRFDGSDVIRAITKKPVTGEQCGASSLKPSTERSAKKTNFVSA
jgi:hypothetical protein